MCLACLEIEESTLRKAQIKCDLVTSSDPCVVIVKRTLNGLSTSQARPALGGCTNLSFCIFSSYTGELAACC